MSTPLGIEKNKIPALSRVPVDMRNYFTHYDVGKYYEPSY